ncbi:LOW QUALITY PROTEIN: free fatty acid receptor 3 [Antechinus flavipes]|uniref:LOW QUALITY PROTEIN: free fatty acid receptor 3 n=1 Tax=Antechinus flavipes TaxID=38775 RepID=UPI002235AE01|nr:LOW QUALITY PROTEIN: free fatty acid receptor 3 [Antechinus flavipes]
MLNPFLSFRTTMNKSAVQGYFSGSHWLYFSVYLFTFLIGLPLNLLALIVFVGKLRRRPLAVDVLLLNLTISDLLLLVFLPFRMIETASAMYWPLPFFLCPLSGFLFFTTIYLSSLILTAVSVERYLGVAYPVWYKTQSRTCQAGLVSVGCWLLGSAHCSLVYVAEFWEDTTQKHQSNRTCYLEFREEQLAVVLPVRLEMAVVLFGVPLVLVSFCYGKMVWILRKGNHLKRRKRVMGLIGATMLNFLVCFGPYNTSHIVGYFQGKSPRWRGYVLLLSTLNSCVDPLVFYFSSSGFQRDFHSLFKNLVKTSGLGGGNGSGIQERNGPEKEQSTC